MMWFTNWTHTDGEVTLPSDMRTYKDYDKQDGIPFFNPDFTPNPWMKPGTANVLSPCGVAGGNPDGCGGGYDCPGAGYGYGKDARYYRDVDWFKNVPVTEWKKGSVVEVGFGLNANHGGGYSYRLCKKQDGKNYTDYLTEECFQAGQLDLLGDISYIQTEKDWTYRIAVKTKRTTNGTYPAGSQWTRIPVPACDGINGITTTHPDGGLVLDGLCGDDPTDTQFPPPADVGHLYGYGVDYMNNGEPALNFNIVDQLKVPENLEEGEYVLSWRWDCEQTPQIWSQCADIKVTA